MTKHMASYSSAEKKYRRLMKLKQKVFPEGSDGPLEENGVKAEIEEAGSPCRRPQTLPNSLRSSERKRRGLRGVRDPGLTLPVVKRKEA